MILNWDVVWIINAVRTQGIIKVIPGINTVFLCIKNKQENNSNVLEIARILFTGSPNWTLFEQWWNIASNDPTSNSGNRKLDR